MKRNVAILLFALCMVFSQSAMAQSDLGLKRVGVAVGMVDPSDADATLGFGVLGDW